MRTKLSPANGPDHQSRSKDFGHRFRSIARWKLLSLVLAGVFTLLSIGLAAHLAAGTTRTAAISCTQGACSNRTVAAQQVIDPVSIGLNLEWDPGTLTALAVLGTWGLGICGLGTGGLRSWTSGRLTVLCLGTLPVYALLIQFSLVTLFAGTIVEHDMVIMTPQEPSALACIVVLLFQSLLQIGFVLAQIGRWLFTRQWFAGAKSSA